MTSSAKATIDSATGKATLAGDATINSITIGLGKLQVTSNTAIGNGALAATVSGGISNTALGYQALNVDTNGNQNVAVGYQALKSNKAGSNNVAIGYQPLYSLIDGNYNIGIGIQALYTNQHGGANSVLGYNAFSNGNGFSYCTGFGFNSGTNNAGNNNSFFGYNCGSNNTSGTDNIVNGATAFYSNKTGSNNVFVGSQAGNSDTLFTRCVGIGYGAIANVVTASSDNDAVGVYALQNTYGTGNVAAGSYSGRQNTSGANNTFVGYGSGTGVTTGSNNLFLYQNPTLTSIGNVGINNSILIGTSFTKIYFSTDSAGNTTVGSKAEANSSIYLHGSVQDTVNIQTVNYTATINDAIILCKTNAFTVTLPTAVGIAGRWYIIKNGNTTLSGNLITIATTSSQTIDGSAPSTLSALTPLRVFSDGSNWWTW